MKITCSSCGKDSDIECSESKGMDAARVESIGWIPKCNALFTKDSSWFYYCSEECKKYHYRKVIDDCSDSVKRQEVKELLAEVKESLKNDMPEILDGLQRITDSFKNL